MRVHRRDVFRTFLIAAAAALGCSPASKKPARTETSHIRLLANLYNRAARDLGRYPKNEQELRDAIGKMDLSLERLKLSSLDEVFVSERDGQPLVIVSPPNENGVIAYEQAGVDGTHLVAFSVGNVQEVDDSRFRELVPQ